MLLLVCCFPFLCCDIQNEEEISDSGANQNDIPDSGTDSEFADLCENPECPDSGVIHVKELGTGCGASWDDAMGDLQNALALAAECTPIQIWVAQGTYIPGSEVSDTFQLISGVELYGGFSGTEAKREQRDWEANQSILSGDLNGDDGTQYGYFCDQPDNAEHVVTGASGAVLDGFTISAGAAASEHYKWQGLYRGAGMLNIDCDETLIIANSSFVNNCIYLGDGAGMSNNNSSPRISNCVFRNNFMAACEGEGYDDEPMCVKGRGGGMANRNHSSPLIEDSLFSDNSAEMGGGIYNYYSTPEVINCSFDSNSAHWGGGMASLHSSAKLVDCLFSENRGYYGIHGYDGGGGMYIESSSPTLERCRFVDNSANAGGGVLLSGRASPVFSQCIFQDNRTSMCPAGGGLGMMESSSAKITNCIFSGNATYNNDAQEGYGGAIWFRGAQPGALKITNTTFANNFADKAGAIFIGDPEEQYFELGSNMEVHNSVFFNNGPDQIVGDDHYDIVNSLVEGGYSGEGNIDSDPLFVDSSDDDFHLQAGSPCIDAGDTTAAPPTDLDGNPRVGEADMGAFEYTPAQ